MTHTTLANPSISLRASGGDWWHILTYDNTDLGQHWLRLWFVAWWHQAITSTNAEFSSARFYGIYHKVISQRVPKLLFCILTLKIILLELLPHVPKLNVSMIYLTKSQCNKNFLSTLLTTVWAPGISNLIGIKLYNSIHYWQCSFHKNRSLLLMG